MEAFRRRRVVDPMEDREQNAEIAFYSNPTVLRLSSFRD